MVTRGTACVLRSTDWREWQSLAVRVSSFTYYILYIIYHILYIILYIVCFMFYIMSKKNQDPLFLPIASVNVDDFYRASTSLCMQSAILFYQFSLSVCLSVCLSVSPSDQCRYCVKTNGHIVTIFDILLGLQTGFPVPPPLQNSTGNPQRGR